MLQTQGVVWEKGGEGQISLAGKQSTCNNRKSLRSCQVICNSHGAAQLTAHLVLQDKKSVLATWVGVDTLEGKGEGSVQQPQLPWSELSKAPRSHFFNVYLGKHTEWQLGDYINSTHPLKSAPQYLKTKRKNYSSLISKKFI